MNQQIRLRNKTVISVVLFAAIFAALAAVATKFDLEISKLLTKNALPAGEYISVNGFGLFFEAVGSAPIWLMIATACTILFWWGMRRKNTTLKIVLAAAGGIVSFIGVLMFVSDAFGYLCRHMGDAEYIDNAYVKAIEAVLALIIWGQFILLWRRVKPEINDKLIMWSAAILCTAALYLIIDIVKSPIGRMRFRAMNAFGDSAYDGFTKWFVVNGKRAPTEAEMIMYGVESDAYKSFPSGHTFSAGMIYTLLCLPCLLERFQKRGWKIALWTGTVLYTGTVAVSRIVVGAHFMSDVLFGGTLAFAGAMLFREIFVCKFSHLKCFKPHTNVISMLEPEFAEEAVEAEGQAEAAALSAEETVTAQEIIESAE